MLRSTFQKVWNGIRSLWQWEVHGTVTTFNATGTERLAEFSLSTNYNLLKMSALKLSFIGPAGALGKQLTTRLWSIFAINPQHKKEIVWWSDKKGKERHVQQGPATPNFVDTAFISALTSSRVRVRLYREALLPGGAVYADTDGAMVPWGTCPEGWTVKQQMEEVEIKAAQAYRWRCKDCGVVGGHPPWHYSVAGIPEGRLAEAIFERLPANYMFDLRSQSITVKQEIRPEWVPDPLEDEAL